MTDYLATCIAKDEAIARRVAAFNATAPRTPEKETTR